MLVYFHLGKKRLQIEGKIVTFSLKKKKRLRQILRLINV